MNHDESFMKLRLQGRRVIKKIRRFRAGWGRRTAMWCGDLNLWCGHVWCRKKLFYLLFPFGSYVHVLRHHVLNNLTARHAAY